MSLNTEYPLVSIIIPVYNAEKHLEETILSAIRQTWPNKEILIIDDGSTDNSLGIAKQFENSWTKIYSQENNGAGAARNKGVKEAKGEYIQFLDADDLLMQNKVTAQVAQLIGHSNKLSICPVIHFNKFNTDVSSLKPADKELALYKDNNDSFKFLLDLYNVKNNKSAFIPIHSWLTPTALINSSNGWNENLTVNDDGEFFCRIVLSSAGILAANDTFCYYRKYVDEKEVSLSGRLDQKSLENHLNSLILIKQHLTGAREDERINSLIADNLMSILMRVYPEYKTLSEKIEGQIKELGGSSYSPILGGRAIEFLKSMLGWKIARLLQYYRHKDI
ncbi:MAG TPA: glycosyltransferase family A protein [Mucilaginibacter sp.]|jgi:glycosyltransferase involved in cell wall biosynthesis